MNDEQMEQAQVHFPKIFDDIVNKINNVFTEFELQVDVK